MNKCYYCGGDANHYFKSANKWCCEYNFNRCPAIREKKRLTSIERYKNISKIGKARASLVDGTAKCFCCGETAYYLISENRTCCEETAYLCPKHKEVVGAIMKQKYEDNPERRVRMKLKMLEAQNRTEVIEKKRETMKKLHNESCDKCVEFQTKYKEGIEKRNNKTYLRHYEYLLDHNIQRVDIPIDKNERAIMVNRVRACITKKDPDK